MADLPNPAIASTPDATAATAQSREPDRSSRGNIRKASPHGAFNIASTLGLAIRVHPYRRKKTDPVYRPLRIFSSDPSASRLEGAIAIINVPYEPLHPGPRGAVVEVDDYDDNVKGRYRKLDLEDAAIMIRDGRDPSASDPLFHQQMAYAVCSTVYATFKTALGRDLHWGFEDKSKDNMRLCIRPHAFLGRNAYYDQERGELCFGYYKADRTVEGRNVPEGWVFTCLSHDVLVHEMAHAILDGLRAHFTLPSGPDVLAFHEAFGDLIAIFQHFGYREVVHAAIRESRGQLQQAGLLARLATQFGQTTGSKGALRTAIDITGESDAPKTYQQSGLEPHELGSILVSAVFEAFTTIFRRKTERYFLLASNGTGVLPMGELPPALKEILAKEASQLASQFLNICIRAIDYCPPVDLEFGEYLRAVITADFDLVPDDPWAYREAWIDAFRRRGIYPRYVSNLSEDALIWRAPTEALPDIAELSFAELRFSGDPGRAAGEDELNRQAAALGQIVTDPKYLELFGLARPHDPKANGDILEPPCVHSIRSSRRAGPDGQVVFDLVAEVRQRRYVRGRKGVPGFEFYGGSTVILGPDGDVRYVVRKSVLSDERLQRQRDFMKSEAARRYWNYDGDKLAPNAQLFRMLHDTGQMVQGSPSGNGGKKTKKATKTSGISATDRR